MIQFTGLKLSKLLLLVIFNILFCFPLTNIVLSASKERNSIESSLEMLQKDIYILGPGDFIEIDILQLPENKETNYILNDGTFPLPFIGNVNIQGLSLLEAKNKMQDLLSTELITPDLQLRLLRPRPINVSVIGEVVTKGIYTLSSQNNISKDTSNIFNPVGMPKIVDAIQKAGGITPESNLREVYLYRKLSGGQKEYKYTKLNLINLFFEGDNMQNPYLFDGDIIKIKKANDLQKDAIIISKTNLSSKFIKVNIIGEVKNPGQIQIPVSTALSQAILISGGLNDLRSSKRNVELLRTNPNGSVSYKKYKIDFSKALNSKNNPVLKSGDTIKVNKTLFAAGSDSIELIAKPVSGIVQSWSLFKLINN